VDEQQIFNSPNWVFISFDQAGRGHRLARVLSSQPDFYWYSHPHNGIQPWNVGRPHSHSGQRQISRYHYDRYVGENKLPPPHDYVEKYIDTSEYYRDIFAPQFVAKGGADILRSQRMIYCTHSLPEPIIQQFPQARVINIIHDIERCVKRYMQIGYLFPGLVKHTGTLPADNPRVRWLTELAAGTDEFRIRDVWAQERWGTYWADGMYAELTADKRRLFTDNHATRLNATDDRILNLWDVRDYGSIKEFLYG